MGIQRHPRGGKDLTANWRHDRCPAGVSQRGWIAGDVHEVTCHPAKGSKPCRKLLLGEHADCPGCKAGWRLVPLGYLPLYRHDGRQLFVILHEHSFDAAAALPLHHYVEWGRSLGAGETVWVRPAAKQETWYTAMPARLRPVDLWPVLCRVWGMPDLLPALRGALSACDNGLSPMASDPVADTVAELAAIEERAKAEQRAAIRSRFTVTKTEPETVGELASQFLNGRLSRSD